MKPHSVAPLDVPRACFDAWDSIPWVINNNVRFSAVLDEVVNYDELLELLILNDLEVL